MMLEEGSLGGSLYYSLYFSYMLEIFIIFLSKKKKKKNAGKFLE